MRFKSISLILFLALGCSKQTKEPEYPARLPITEQAKELTTIPAYVAPSSEGKIVDVEEKEAAPFAGVLLDEIKATKVAELRIAYDEVYRLALADRKYALSVIQIQEQELYRADKLIDVREKQLKEIRDSWWERNKVWVGVGVGLLGGVGVSLAAGTVWSRIEK
jgi:hypothetical protein